MTTERTALQLIDLIYAAAEAPERWREFLQCFAAAVGGSLTTFILQDTDTQHGLLAMSINADPDYVRRYDEYYCHQNLYMIHGRHLMKPGRVLTSQMLCPDEILLKSEFYADYLKPQDVYEQMGIVLASDPRRVCGMTTMRSKAKGPFENEKIELFELLIPHLERGIRLHQVLQNALHAQRSTETALEFSPVATIVVDDQGSVVMANGSARAVIGLRDGILIEQNRISVSRPAELALLHALIRSALQSDQSTAVRGGAMTISRPSGRRNYQVVVGRPTHTTTFPLPRKTVVVFIVDPDAERFIDLDLLRTIHGFTPAEARLAAELLRGYSVDEAAALLEISALTARTRLKQMFHKTGTRRQAELILILSRGLTGTMPNASTAP